MSSGVDGRIHILDEIHVKDTDGKGRRSSGGQHVSVMFT